MAKIKVINRKTLKTIRADFDKSMESLSKKTGLAFKMGSISFNDASFTAKLEVVIMSDGNMSAQEAMGRNSLDLEGAFLGLNADDYGRTFVNWDGNTYRLTGVKSSRPKYPISAVNLNTGKSFKFGENIVEKLSKRIK